MAFKATTETPADGLHLAKRTANNIKARADRYSAEFSQTTDRAAVADAWLVFAAFSDELDRLASIPGIADYAREQEGDLAYDIVAEFNALRTATEAVVTEIESTFPTDATGHLSILKFGLINGKRRLVNGTFPAAAVAPLKALMDAVSAQVS